MISEKNISSAQSYKISQNEVGLKFITINNELASAKIALQGAHVMQWKPHNIKNEVLWLSSNARYMHGRSIRGGVPICWPWFGAHPTDGSFCPHGFARVIPWRINEIIDIENGATKVTLVMLPTPEVNRQLSYQFNLELSIIIGNSIHLDLKTTNLSEQPFLIGEGYHTYFGISDIENIKVTGLENKIYSDKVRGYKKFTQEDQIKFDAEFDRVYLNTRDTCVIHDEGFNRKITIQKQNSESTVIWTPWDKKVKTMVDMGTEHEWKKMICVESVNALENSVIVYPNQSHSLIAEYLVQEY
jgi:glucose-6-phosphate 1-epimerase